jgi:hypothetical protein
MTMSSIEISSVVFACLFAGGLVGMLLRAKLPEHHFSSDSKDAVKLGMALISTMSALVLGLLVSSAKGSFDAAKHGTDRYICKYSTAGQSSGSLWAGNK